MPTDPTHPPSEPEHDLHVVPPSLSPETAPPRSPPIPREWVDAYLQRLERLQGARVAREVGKQLGLFLDYVQRNSAERLPWWEYSLALEWINERTSGFRLTLSRARRLLDTLRDFYAALVDAGHVQDCHDVDQARAVFCGGRTLRLLPRPPRTGTEAWTALHPPDGPLVTFSVSDFWLCVLWTRAGRSWTALEERVALVPGGAARLADLEGLRQRLVEAQCSSPQRLVSQHAPTDHEDALRWLSAPAVDAAASDPLVDPATADLALPDLIGRLATSFPGMPRLEMEECLRRGDEVVPACIALLDGDGVAGGLTDPVWAIAVLGELGDLRALPVLARSLTIDDDGGTAVAAAEALGKMGPGALPILDATIATGSPTARLYAYGALGMIHTDDAYQRLVNALTRDPDLSDVIARALVEHGRRDAIDLLHQVSGRVTTSRWMQLQFESAIVALLDGRMAADTLSRDWRLRYRRLPALDWSFPLSWLSIAALTHRHHADAGHGLPGALRPLSEIVADVRLRPDERPCLQCGGRRWEPTGLPLCRHTARGLIALQTAVVARWVHAGHADVWSALDECDAIELRHQHRRPERQPRWAEHERDLTAIGRATLYWLVPLLRRDATLTLASVTRYLRVLGTDVAMLYGDAQSTPQKSRTAPRALPKFS